MAITRLFDLSSRALSTYQQALSVTSNNIANSSNANYSRQRVVLSTTGNDTSGPISLGRGVKLQDIVRVKNQITDSQLRTYNQQNSFYTKQSDYLKQIESLMSEPGDQGLTTLINNFFNSFQSASVHPESMTLRQGVVQSAQLMSTKFQNITDGLAKLKPDVKAEADTLVAQINKSFKDINTLNKQIYEASVAGSTANDLMDQRDAVIDSLSKLANINVSYDKENSALVSMGGVLAADRFNYMEFKAADVDGALKIQTSDGAATANLQNGELGALTQLYSNSIPEYQKKIDAVANAIMKSVNQIHSTGYNVQSTPQTGVNFFSSYLGGKLAINSDILNDVKNLALSSDKTSGNNEIALKLAGIKSTVQSSGSTISDMYSDFISTLGGHIQTAEQSADSSGLVITQLQQQKEATSGVSVDEEMINILKYQRSYDAAAKLIKSASEMLETLMNMV